MIKICKVDLMWIIGDSAGWSGLGRDDNEEVGLGV